MGHIFQVLPTILKADRENEITIRSFDGFMRFFDDVTYKVQIAPMEEYDIEYPEDLKLRGLEVNRKTFYVKPVNGELKLKYFFAGEQEWSIRVATEEYQNHYNQHAVSWGPTWAWVNKVPERWTVLSVYSLYDDLYSRRPQRCDFHSHTNKSDGRQIPTVAAAVYRRKGYDKLAITDHAWYNTAKEVNEAFADLKTSFEVMTGEEVHNGYNGYFHMVSIGGSYSISDIFINEPERVKKEVAELAKTVDVPEGLDKNEYLNRVWMYREIKKSGGLSIHVHPYWRVGDIFHTQTSMSRAIFKNHLCDTFEVIGDNRVQDNNLQTTLFYEMQKEGFDYPFTASTDCHDVFYEKGTFGRASTIVFDDGKGVVPAIYDKYSVAVESNYGEIPRIYGSFRLTKYAHFLLKHYYPGHDNICFAQGDMMYDYCTGSEELKDQINACEARLDKYNKEFFEG